MAEINRVVGYRELTLWHNWHKIGTKKIKVGKIERKNYENGL
ncbi:hypothetical protein [Fictibacillus sp. NRS-1165]